MRFASPAALWLLMALPLLVAYLIHIRPGNIPSFRFSSIDRMASLLDARGYWGNIMALGTLRLLAVILLIIALARPQRGLKSEEMTTKATDIVICLDASRSMLITDFKPDNRFSVAKQVIRNFIEGREHDRLGMIAFAEHAVTLCPLTLDRSALLSIVDGLQVGIIPPDQTAIGVGLATSVNRLKKSIAKSKVIVLLTDGSNNAGSIDPVTAAKTAASFGIKVYAIGVASPEGGTMPINDPVFGQRMVPIKTDLDEDTLLKVSSETKGKYFRAKNAGALKAIFDEIDSLEKTDIKVKEYVDYEELFVWFVLAAAFLVLIELALGKTAFRTLP